MRLLLLGCGLLMRELSDAIVRSPHLIEAQFLPAGLHDLGAENMRHRLQAAIDAADPNYDVIVLGYALCGNGLAGLRARRIPLVVPRAHDCITLLMGSRSKFQTYFEANPGVYYRSVGWVEHGEELQQQIAGLAIACDRNALIERYGESNGQYLFEEYTKYLHTYRQLTYIETGLEPDGTFLQRAQAEAAAKNWTFTKLTGDLTLFRRLLSGDWNADFLVVPPRNRIDPTYDHEIVKAVPDAGF
ncbi:MAG: DUF1638 domain-containing protein [Terriglobales bacterium]